MPLVQKYIVEDASKASSLLPQHVAFVNPDGTAYKMPVAEHVDPSTGTTQQIINALIAAGLMADAAEESNVQTMAAAAPMSVDENQADADTKLTMESTADEIRAYATEHGIEVPSKATKAEMLELIGQERINGE